MLPRDSLWPELVRRWCGVEGTGQIIILNSPHVTSSWSYFLRLETPLAAGMTSVESHRRTEVPSARYCQPEHRGVSADPSGPHSAGVGITLLS